MSTTTWERRDCVSAEVEDSLVLLDLETLMYHSLNSTAAAVWEILSQPRSEEAIVEQLCARYNVTPEHCRISLDKLLNTLALSGLVRRSDAIENSAR